MDASMVSSWMMLFPGFILASALAARAHIASVSPAPAPLGSQEIGRAHV